MHGPPPSVMVSSRLSWATGTALPEPCCRNSQSFHRDTFLCLECGSIWTVGEDAGLRGLGGARSTSIGAQFGYKTIEVLRMHLEHVCRHAILRSEATHPRLRIR